MGAVSSKYGSIEVAKESSYGGGAAAASDDALLLAGKPTVNVMRENVMRNDWVKGGQGGYAHAKIDSHIEYQFTTRVGGLGISDDTAPAVGPLFVGGGMQETVSGSAGTTDLKALYELLTYGHGSVEIKHRMRDRSNGDISLHTIVGCRHNWTLRGALNNDLLQEINGQGKYAEPGAFASATGPTTLAKDVGILKVSGLTLTIDGTAYKVTEFSVTPNWAVRRVENIAAASNADEIVLDRNDRPQITVNPLAEAGQWASSALMDTIRNADEIAFQAVLSATGLNTKITIDAPKMQAAEWSLSEADNDYRHDLTFACNETSHGDDDDITVTFDYVA